MAIPPCLGCGEGRGVEESTFYEGQLVLRYTWVELVEFNGPLDKVISETSLSSQSLGYGTDKTNLLQPR